MRNNNISMFIMLFFLSFQMIYGMKRNNLNKKYNFHQVDKNVFRSGLIVSSKDLRKLIESHGLKKIFAFTKKDETIAQTVALEKGISWKFLALPASKAPTIEDFSKLVDVVKIVDSPTLFHDRDGANRTGFFSALYLLLTLQNTSNQKTLDEALDQFSFQKYGYYWFYHQFFSTGGVYFMRKFGQSYFILQQLIQKNDFDANNLSDDQIEKLRSGLKIEGLEDYLEYALYALTQS